MKVGTRIIKTGIAVIITMYLCKIFNLEPALFGAVSAVANMQPTLYLTLKKAKEQVIIHIIGVSLGLAAGYVLGANPFIMGAVTVCIIVLYTRLKLQGGILMGIVAALFVLSSPASQFLEHAYSRSFVIFIGLFVAMTVNAILWPPKYGYAFVEKLRRCNESSVDYFCRAVHDFIRLDNEEIPLPEQKRKEVVKLNEECRVIAEYYRSEKKSFGDGYDLIDPNDWFVVAERLLIYNDSLREKADQIYQLLPYRLERRIKAGAPPISGEYNYMLEILKNGCATIERVNKKLRTSICEKISVDQERISEELWEELREAIEEWQPRLAGSYYIHALIEISVVANEIRWLAREGKKLLKMSADLNASGGAAPQWVN
ncbi:lipoprotein [Desulfocucumis palustris]|uniref:Lipoprotein n=1 Tax=Desulfocucumis palustris TaxID=1898651 RepID=A0A2L2XEV0_9FIRM|nr:aromatic acid exporter family protein [Desulfocucumis palustris]GBF34768.1 lipoprotein [Desulfocucumis palustris]